jgi:hypothetical protein
MNFRTLLTLCLLTFWSLVFCQENEKSNLGYTIDFGMGKSTVDHNRFGEIDGNVTFTSIRLNFGFDDFLFRSNVSTGLQFLEFRYDRLNDPLGSKVTNRHLQIPLMINNLIALDKNKKLNFNSGLGLYYNILLSSNIQNGLENSKVSGGTSNFGNIYNVGLQYAISPKSSLGLNLTHMNESRPVRAQGMEIRQIGTYILNLGFTSRF